MKKLIFLTVFFALFITASAMADGIQIIGQPGNYNIKGGDEFIVESEEVINKEAPAPVKTKKRTSTVRTKRDRTERTYHKTPRLLPEQIRARQRKAERKYSGTKVKSKKSCGMKRLKQ